MAKKPANPNIITIDTTPNAEAAARVSSVTKDAAPFTKPLPNLDGCKEATIVLGRVQTLRRDIKKWFDVTKRPILDAQRKVNDEQNGYLTSLESLENALTREINAFRDREAQERAAKAEAERKEREEAARKEQEQRAAELRAAAAAAPTKKVAKLLEQQADTLATADVFVEHAAPPEAAEVLGSGQHDRRFYYAAVHSKERLILQVAAQLMIAKYGAPPAIAGWLQQFKPNAQASADCLTPHMPQLTSLAKLGPDMALEGVTAEHEDKIITRR